MVPNIKISVTNKGNKAYNAYLIFLKWIIKIIIKTKSRTVAITNISPATELYIKFINTGVPVVNLLTASTLEKKTSLLTESRFAQISKSG